MPLNFPTITPCIPIPVLEEIPVTQQTDRHRAIPKKLVHHHSLHMLSYAHVFTSFFRVSTSMYLPSAVWADP